MPPQQQHIVIAVGDDRPGTGRRPDQPVIDMPAVRQFHVRDPDVQPRVGVQRLLGVDGPAHARQYASGPRRITPLRAAARAGILPNVDPQIVRYSERPELWDGRGDLFDDVWPEYNQHGDELNYYWRQLYDVFPEWQFMLLDSADQTILAEGHTVPVAWDRTDEGLGPGIDATIAGAFRLREEGGRPTAVSAMAAEVPPRHQGRGLAPVMLTAMAALTREAGLEHLIAPIRPSHKDRYPTIPIERYARWALDDGTPFDPWVRVHVRMGARIGPVIPRSLHITGTVADWESWTQMRFPETGDYVFPAGLATVRIDREKNTGEYWEPNVWIIHQAGHQAGR